MVKFTPLTSELEMQVCKDYLDPKVLTKDICAKYNLSWERRDNNYIGNILKRNNIPLRSQTRGTLPKRPKSKPMLNIENISKSKQIHFQLSPRLYNGIVSYCTERNITPETFIKKYFTDYIYVVCEGIGIVV
jgi:hypothetical protein